MISKYYSDKIRVMNFIAIIFVVFIHSPYTEAAGRVLPLAIQRGITESGLAIFAVPMFFAISGMLFFNGIKKWEECLPKMRRRIKTLLIPYLIWNLIFVGWYAIMDLIPGISQFVNSNIFMQLSWDKPFSVLETLFVEPAGFHLWFLRDLMIYVLFSPLIYIGIRKFAWGGLFLMFLGLGWIPRMGITYFMLGGIVSVHSNLEQIAVWMNRKVVIALLSIYLLNSIAASLGFVYPGNIFYQYYAQILGLVSIAAVWGVYDLFMKDGVNLMSLSNRILSFSFFIYLFHEPAFNIIKKMGLRMLGVQDWSIVLLFLINPFVMVAFAIGVGIIFKRIFPKIYSVCVGGR